MGIYSQPNARKKPQAASSGPTPGLDETQEISIEKHYSVSELAKLWKLSETTIRRMFETEPGVIVWGTGEARFKRKYRTLRIPERVVARVHRQLRIAV